MKHNLLLIVLAVFLLNSMTLFAESISVKESKTLNIAQTEGMPTGFASPSFSPDGKEVLLTTATKTGLWLYNLESEELREVTDKPGAGVKPAFTDSGEVLYRYETNVNGQRHFALESVSNEGNGKNFKVLLPSKRKLDHSEVAKIKKNSRARKGSISEDSVELYNQYGTLVVSINGTEREIKPYGDGIYINESLSPDNTKIISSWRGVKTFVSDLDGNILVELGKISSPTWSPDGKWIAYTVIEDDHDYLTASDIYIVSSDGKQKYKITDTDDKIELSPQWSPSGTELVYSTLAGEIEVITLEIVD